MRKPLQTLERTDTNVSATLDDVRVNMDALLQRAAAYRWAAPLGAALALGMLVVVVARAVGV